MTVIGVLLGRAAGQLLGDAAGYLGFAALIGVGGYMIYEALHGTEEGGGFDLSRGFGLVLGALSISLDSLGIGFSILYIGVPLVIQPGLHRRGVGFVDDARAGAGQAARHRRRRARRAVAGVVLVLTGVAFAGLKFFHVGV